MCYTSIEQSNVLKGILSIDTADVHYWSYKNGTTAVNIGHSEKLQKNFESRGFKYIPSWSLTALLNALRKVCEEVRIETHGEEKWICRITEPKTSLVDWCIMDNPVDACYGMIITLHKINVQFK